MVTQTFCVGTETKATLHILNKECDKESERERKTDTERYNEALCPSKTTSEAVGETKDGAEGQTSDESLENFRKKMTHFFHLQSERLLIKATYNTMLRRESFFPFVFLQLYWKSYGT